MEESYDAKARRIRGVLADLGMDAGKVAVGCFGRQAPSADPLFR